jgi:hypothetical protein
MTPEFLRAFLRAGVFVALVSLVLVFAVHRDSAEFVISVCSLIIGVTLIGLVALVSRLGNR